MKLLISLVLLILTPNLTLAQEELILGTVVGVETGDLIKINSRGKSFLIQLGCVDAPDLNQTPWGQQAKQRLQKLLPIGIQIQIRTIDTDDSGKIVGEILTSNTGININIKMVAEGQAVVDPRSLNGCLANKEEYLYAEAKAKEQRLGYWNQSNPVMPWDYQ